MGNSLVANNQEEGVAVKPSQLQGLRNHSKIASSFGNLDPYTSFETDIQNWCDQRKIPGLGETETYQIYVWRKGKFDHHSIVIGCQSKPDTGFITMELYADTNTEKVYPVTQYIDIETGIENIVTEKWRQCIIKDDLMDEMLIRANMKKKGWNGEVETTIRDIIKLTIDLVNHHGKYSEIANSCQDFVINFAKKCAEKEGARAEEHCVTGGAAGVVLGGSGIGVLGTALAGAMVGGPPGAVVGAVCGGVGGSVIGLGSFGVAKSLHKNESDKVELGGLEVEGKSE